MFNPLIIPILEYLRVQHSSCSLLDLVKLCEQELLLLIGKDNDFQLAIFQKNFFVMNALYQIQADLQTEGYTLTISPVEITLLPNHTVSKPALTTRDNNLANYYGDWTNLTKITVADIEALFANFWQKYHAFDKVAAALNTLELGQDVEWHDIRKAYHQKIAISHPDKGGSTKDFIEVRKAYEILSARFRNN